MTGPGRPRGRSRLPSRQAAWSVQQCQEPEGSYTQSRQKRDSWFKQDQIQMDATSMCD